VHRNTLNISAKTSPTHLTICLTAVKVHASFDSLQTALCGERVAGVQ
jgi:hypothetical protein